MVDTDQVPPALLFSGPSGVGKTTAARVLASQVQASDVIEVDAASNGGVDQIRKILDVAQYSTGGTYRMVILDEAHSITRQGFEALLKSLEEPPANTIFVLVTTEPHKIPPTVLSRLVEFQFRAITEADVLDRLTYVVTQESIPAEFPLLTHIVRRAAGNLRTALTSLDQVWRAGISTKELYQAITGEHDPAPELLEACARGDHAQVFEVLDTRLSTSGSPSQIVVDLTACLRDLLVLRSGGTIAATGEDYERRRGLAAVLEPERLLAAVRVLWSIKATLRSDDPRGTLELALVLITEALSKGRVEPAPVRVIKGPDYNTEVYSTPPAPAPIEAPARLSFSELQQQVSGNNTSPAH